MTYSNTIDYHKRNLNIAMNGMKKALEPLNERLKPLNMKLWVADGTC